MKKGSSRANFSIKNLLNIFSIRVQLKNFDQTLIVPDPVFNHDPDRDENFSARVCLKNFNQGPVKFFQSESGDQKLITCALLHTNRSRRGGELTHGFSIRVCLKNFNQSLLKIFQSGSG